MNSSITRSFSWSLALHVSCCALLCIVIARPQHEFIPAVTPRDIFRLVPSSEAVSNPGPSSDTAPTVRIPELPRIKISPAADNSQPQTSAQPTRSVSQANAPIASTQSQRVSFDRYRRMHGLSNGSPRKPIPVANSNGRRINVADFAYNGTATTAPSSSDSVNSSELNENFISGLLFELKRSYAGREAGFAGLSVEVEFVLGPNGRLKTSQLLTSSGQAEFDQAVLEALQHVQLVNCPADAAGRRFKTRFVISNP
ncbi:MAG: TonB family protein [Nibricoccus sp.]